MWNELSQIFQTNTKILEILYVMEGVKPVARLSVSEDNLIAITSFCRKNNLYFEISDYKILMEFDGSYSSKGMRVGCDEHVKGHYFMYISKDKNNSRSAKRNEAEGNHEKAGELFGYPACCIRFFKDHMQSETKSRNDYVIPMMQNSNGLYFPFMNNIFGRYFDYPLINHVPCSFDCRFSHEIAVRNLAVIQKHAGHLKDIFISLLSSPVLYLESGEFCILTNAVVKDNLAVYEDVLFNRKNDLFNTLRKHHQLTVDDKGIVIDDKLIRNSKAKLILFR